MRPPRRLSVPPRSILHPQRRVTGPHRVVLVRHRRPEQRHDPVPHHLVHRPLVAMDGLHHQRQHRIEDLAGLLRVAIGEQLHRTLEIGEQHGHLLALPLQGGLGGEDLLGQVLGGVGVGSRKCGRGRQGGTATPTELHARLVREAARGTGEGQRRPTLSAEPPSCAVGRATTGTGHLRLAFSNCPRLLGCRSVSVATKDDLGAPSELRLHPTPRVPPSLGHHPTASIPFSRPQKGVWQTG
jgi:hypothetical protein